MEPAIQIETKRTAVQISLSELLFFITNSINLIPAIPTY